MYFSHCLLNYNAKIATKTSIILYTYIIFPPYCALLQDDLIDSSLFCCFYYAVFYMRKIVSMRKSKPTYTVRLADRVRLDRAGGRMSAGGLALPLPITRQLTRLIRRQKRRCRLWHFFRTLLTHSHILCFNLGCFFSF